MTIFRQLGFIIGSLTPSKTLGVPMNIKHSARLALGVLILLVGACLSVALLPRLVLGRIGDFWQVGIVVLLAALSAYLIYSGLRLINPQRFKPPKFGWGKIILGSFLLFGQVGSHYHPSEGPLPLFRPSNPTQAASMRATSVVIDLVCVYLIFRGVWQGFSRREPQPNTQPPQSSA
jgi:membrane protease YdiL (CAAX protease family)